MVTAYNSSSTSLVVKWSQLTEEQFQGQPVGYLINYYAFRPDGVIKDFIVNYTTNTTTLTDLIPYTVYVIYVSAISSGGTGALTIAQTRTGAAGIENSWCIKIIHVFQKALSETKTFS